MKPLTAGQRWVGLAGVAIALAAAGMIAYIATHYDDIRREQYHRQLQYYNKREPLPSQAPPQNEARP